MSLATIAVPGYRLDRILGRGGFGIVWLATREADGQTVAVKVLHRLMDPTSAARFDDEIQTMGTLAWHPNIVQIQDAGRVHPAGEDGEAGQAFIAMEYLPGGSLGDRLRSHGPAPVPDVIATGMQAATGLQVAHNAGVLHRDVKPDNLLIGGSAAGGGAGAGEIIKVSDFGIAVSASGASGSRGATGTLAYSAPELLGGGSASVASDVYALGATMYALLTGEAAFHRQTDESPAALILRAYTQPVPDVRDRGVPAALAHVIERAMAKQPEDRPASAEALALELAGAARTLGLPVPAVAPAGRPTPAAAPAFTPPPEERAKAQRLTRLTRRVGAVAMALIAVAFIGVSTFTGQSEDAAAPPPEDASVEAPAADEAAADEAAADPAEGADQGEGEAPPVAATPLPAEPAPQPSSNADEGGGDDQAEQDDLQEAVPPPPAAPPPPAPAPPLQAVAVPLDPEVLAGGDGQVYVADGQEIVVVDLETGAAEVLASGADVLDLVTLGGRAAALLTDGAVIEIAADGSVRSPDLAATAIASVGQSLFVATDDGLVRVDADGAQTRVAEERFVSLAAGPRTIWGVTGGGGLVSLDLRAGAAAVGVRIDPLLGSIRAIAVASDGTLVLGTDEGVQQVDLEGTVTPLGPVVVDDLVVGPDDTIYGLSAGAVGVLGPAETFSTIAVGGPATAIAADDDGLVVGVSYPPRVARPGG